MGDAKCRDSNGLKYNGLNPWCEIGAWSMPTFRIGQAKNPTRMASSFDHGNRPHPRHFLRNPGPMHHLHDLIHVLVGKGRLFSQTRH